jgi:hypothetical protein
MTELLFLTVPLFRIWMFGCQLPDLFDQWWLQIQQRIFLYIFLNRVKEMYLVVSIRSLRQNITCLLDETLTW